MIKIGTLCYVVESCLASPRTRCAVGKVVGGPPETVQAGPASVIHAGDHALGIPGTEADLDALAEPVDGPLVVPDVCVGEPGSVVEP